MGAIKSLLGLVLLVAVVLISYAMGSDATITANEAPYTDTFWLKITDMFIYSIYFLLGIAAITVKPTVTPNNAYIKYINVSVCSGAFISPTGLLYPTKKNMPNTTKITAKQTYKA
jgi:hypothetical protein